MAINTTGYETILIPSALRIKISQLERANYHNDVCKFRIFTYYFLSIRASLGCLPYNFFSDNKDMCPMTTLTPTYFLTRYFVSYICTWFSSLFLIWLRTPQSERGSARDCLHVQNTWGSVIDLNSRALSLYPHCFFERFLEWVGSSVIKMGNSHVTRSIKSW